MQLEVKKYLFDISESIASIEKYLGDKRDFNIYLADKMLRRRSNVNLRSLAKP